MRLLPAALACAIVLQSGAAAADDCPPGSVPKNQDAFGWCEPTVCKTDDQCRPDEVCRNVPLCMEVGNVAAAGRDGGQRLVVTQRCAPDKSCPQTTVCSDLGRCLSKNAAEKMGVLALPASSATPTLGAEKKSSCGCSEVGSGVGGRSAAGGVLVLLGLVVLSSRRSGSNATGSRRG